jgi:hypothetical protein
MALGRIIAENEGLICFPERVEFYPPDTAGQYCYFTFQENF